MLPVKADPRQKSWGCQGSAPQCASAPIASRRRWFSLALAASFRSHGPEPHDRQPDRDGRKGRFQAAPQIQHDTDSSEYLATRHEYTERPSPAPDSRITPKLSLTAIKLQKYDAFVVPKTSTDAAFLSPNSEQRESLWG